MLSKEFNIILDIKRQLSIEQMTVVQGDLNSNVINIKLENDGKEYDLTGTKVEIVFAKPDNTTVLQSDIAMINEKEGQIRCVLKTNTIAAPGVAIAEVRVRSAEDDKLLTSAQFRLHVRKSLMSDEVIESTDDFDVLTELIKEVEELLKEAEEANLPELIILKEELENLREELTSKQAELIELQDEIEIKETQRDKRYEEMGLLKENMESLKIELEKLEKDLLDLKEKLINSIPFINDKGNWQVGDEDTEVKAQGPKGDKGETGGVNSVNELKGDVVLTGDNIKIDDKTISEEISDIKLTNKAEQERLDNLSKVVVESGNSMSKSISDLEKTKWGKDELELGGRNLIKGYPTNEKLNIKTKDNFYEGFNTQIKPRVGDIYTINFDFEVIEGDNMHFSIGTGENHYARDIRSLKGLNDKPATFKVEERHIINENTQIWVRVNRKNSPHDSEVNYWNIKLEKGNIATDWTPAPEDLDGIQTQPAPLANMAHVEYLENQIKELREMIALRGLSR